MTCSMPRHGALVIALTSLAACATAGSEACPPVAVYDGTFRQRAAVAVDALPPDSPLAAMLADYAVMREQARACGG